MFHNSTRSPLASLPNAILVRMMEHMDEFSLFCLRQTCQTMLRLFSNYGFCHSTTTRALANASTTKMWTTTRTIQTGPEVLSHHGRGSWSQKGQRSSWVRCSRRTCIAICVGAPDVELRLRTELLYCSGCKGNHPVGLFYCRNEGAWM